MVLSSLYQLVFQKVHATYEYARRNLQNDFKPTIMVGTPKSQIYILCCMILAKS